MATTILSSRPGNASQRPRVHGTTLRHGRIDGDGTSDGRAVAGMSGDGAQRLAGGLVISPDGVLERLDVVIEHGRIVALDLPGHGDGGSNETIDVSDRIIAPGFIDIQINGGWGHDFTAEPASIATVAEHLPATGVTAFLPTIISCSSDRRRAAIVAVHQIVVRDWAATPLGLHLEGPAISPDRPGAHDPRWIGDIPAGELAAWTRANGVMLATLAPERDGAIEVVAELASHGVVVSSGHTTCTPERFDDARRAGVRCVTHLFNAMGSFSHRSPGPIGATLADDSVAAGLICDGIHVDPVAIRMVWRALGPTRMILVSDATAALGAAEPSSVLGDRAVTVGADGVRTADGALAGSSLPLDQAVRNLVEFTGCSPTEAIRTVTRTPAELLGLADRGHIDIGARADLVVLDQRLEIDRTIVGGVTAWKS
jgi:N-acetylglucosamine-6-phosphate deacetylase